MKRFFIISIFICITMLLSCASAEMPIPVPAPEVEPWDHIPEEIIPVNPAADDLGFNWDITNVLEPITNESRAWEEPYVPDSTKSLKQLDVLSDICCWSFVLGYVAIGILLISADHAQKEIDGIEYDIKCIEQKESKNYARLWVEMVQSQPGYQEFLQRMEEMRMNLEEAEAP